MARIKLLRNKRDIQVKQMRKEIVQLLQTGQEPSARIRVEHINREQNIMAAYDIVELFCELIVVRLPIIESQKLCPMDLKEAVSSLIFASPRCADLPELLQIRALFQSKYGKEFVAAAADLRPDCGVNRRIIEKLSVRAPSGEVKLKLLKEIAAEHNLDWDPADTEAELLKPPEDLLDGPKKFIGATMMPFPPEYISTSLPRQNSQSQHIAPSTPPVRMAPEPAPAPAPTPTPTPTPAPPARVPSASKSMADSSLPDAYPEPRQFIPFVVPMNHTVPASGKQENMAKGSFNSRASEPGFSKASERYESQATQDESHVKRDGQVDYESAAAAAKAAALSADRAVAAARAAAKLAKGQDQTSGSGSLSRKMSQLTDRSSSDDSSDDEVPVDRNPKFSRTVEPQGAPSRSRQETSIQEKYGYPYKVGDSEDSNYKDSSEGDYSDAKAQQKSDPEQVWPKRAEEYDEVYEKHHEAFRRSESELPSRRVEEAKHNAQTFLRNDSTGSLFKGSSTDETDLRSSDEAFYDSLQGFSRPKFDEEDEYSRSSGSRKGEDDFFDRKGGKKATFTEYWRTQSLSFTDDKDIIDEISQKSDKTNAEKLSQSSAKLDEPKFDDSYKYGGRNVTDSDSSVSKQSWNQEDFGQAQYEKQGKELEPSLPKPRTVESRRTRTQWATKVRDRSDDGRTSVSPEPSHPPLNFGKTVSAEPSRPPANFRKSVSPEPSRPPLNFGKRLSPELSRPPANFRKSLSPEQSRLPARSGKPKFSSSSYYELSPPPSPPPGHHASSFKYSGSLDYDSPPFIEPSRDFDESPPIMNTSNVPSRGHHTSSSTSSLQVPPRQLNSSFGHRHSDPSPATLASNAPKSISSPSSGSPSPLHPKLPDYDDIAARFQALKTKY